MRAWRCAVRALCPCHPCPSPFAHACTAPQRKTAATTTAPRSSAARSSVSTRNLDAPAPSPSTSKPKRGRADFATNTHGEGVRETITGSASRKGSGGRGDRGAEGADTPDVERGALEPRFSQAMEVDADVGARDASPARSTKRARVSSGKSILFVGFDCPKVRERQRHMDEWIAR